MDAEKEKRLEALGWRTGSVAEFLNLSPEEAALVEERVRVHRFPANSKICACGEIDRDAQDVSLMRGTRGQQCHA